MGRQSAGAAAEYGGGSGGSGSARARAARRVSYLKDEPGPTAPRMVLGSRLTRLRTELHLEQQDVVERLRQAAPGVPRLGKSKISRIESGRIPTKDEELAALLALYGVAPGSRLEAQLHDLLRIAREPGWWAKWSGVMSRCLQSVVSLEDAARVIKAYEPQTLFGLLQTQEYTWALMRNMAGGSGRLAATAGLRAKGELREERQNRFWSSQKQLTCVIDELSLLRPVGNREIMRRQLEHLISLAEDQRVSFRLAEVSRPNLPVLRGTTLFEFEEELLHTIAYAETDDGGGLFYQDQESVDRRAKMFDALACKSLAPSRTVQRMKDLLVSAYR